LASWWCFFEASSMIYSNYFTSATPLEVEMAILKFYLWRKQKLVSIAKK